MEQKLNYPLQMYFVTSTQGNITPIRFKYENKDHEIITVNVDEVHSHKEMTIGKGGSILFVCSSEIEGQKLLYELRYEIGTHKWILSGRLN